MLDIHRQQLLDCYSDLPQRDAPRFYRNHGDQEKIIRAWETNADVLTRPTMPAIDRYCGTLYSALDPARTQPFRVAIPGNVLIVSAMMGVIAPSDQIPDYE